MELDALRTFIEVLDSGGFSRAAERLGISKSMASRRVAQLEAELGTRLVSRTTRRIAPTEPGLELKLRAERVIAELEEAREAVAEQGAGAVGRLRVSLPMSFGVRQIAPVLAELVRRHPRLELDTYYSDRVVDLIEERFDAAVRIGVLRDSSLVARRIAPVRAIVVASPDYLARRGRPASPADLTRHDCLITNAHAVPDWVFRAGKRSIPIRPAGRLRADSGEVLLRWAAEGLGIAALPSFLLGDEIGSGRLEPLLLEYELPGGAIHVVRPPGRLVPGKVRAFIDLLVEHFGGEPVWDRCLMHERMAR